MAEWTYQRRMESLRKTKQEHTFAKRAQKGYTDEDDYGNIPVPPEFRFRPQPNSPNGGVYGYDGLSRALEGMLDAYPVYVDPLEILCGRWSKLLTDYRAQTRWDEVRFPYDDLKPLQKLYDITSGLDNEAHCTPDFRIGLRLGFGGLLEKVRFYRKLNPDRREYYDAEERVLMAIERFIGRHIEKIKALLAVEDRPEICDSLRQMLSANQNILTRPRRRFWRPASGRRTLPPSRAPTTATAPATSSTSCSRPITSATSKRAYSTMRRRPLSWPTCS